jgi:phosphoglucomutase
MDEPQYCPFLCGEESFGTGSNHVREKDGLWAVLAWLSILADANKDTPVGSLVSVEDIVRSHWATYGRNFYCRYDYENVDSAAAEAMMAHLRSLVAGGPSAVGPLPGGYALAVADEFCYTDPVDGSVSARQGLRFIMADGSRVVYRLSGTGSVGATVRVYIEKYEPDAAKHDTPTADALGDLVTIATATLGRVEHFTGRAQPTVIT